MTQYNLPTSALRAVMGMFAAGYVRNPQTITQSNAFDPVLEAAAKDKGFLEMEILSATLLDAQNKTAKTSDGREYAKATEVSAKFLVVGKVGDQQFTVKCHACDLAAVENGKGIFQYNGGEIPRAAGQQPVKWCTIVAKDRKSEAETFSWLKELAVLAGIEA